MVHVSTAYSNADKQIVEEIVYSPPANPLCIIKCCEDLNEDLLNELEKILKKNHPNTYTLTKAMAEWIVCEESKNIPTAIVRPSIGNPFICLFLLLLFCFFKLTKYFKCILAK